METISYGEVPPGTSGASHGDDRHHLLGGTYLLEREIGRGGMGEVYLATHARLPGRFAVKLLLPELAENREAFARFCREAEIMSELRHPNIVQIFDFNIAPDERPYFVMEYLEGRDLEARLAAGSMPLAAVVRTVNAVASALAVAHAHGVVHRDLKPSNIFLATINGQTDELIKVLDFGISKIRSAPQPLSQSSALMGTPPYMAPEQVRGQIDAIDGRTDQFALGAICYRMLTGQEAFRGDEVASLLYQVVHENPPPISSFVPPTWDPAPLQAVLDRAMMKDPAQRWGGMMEMARAFEEAAERTICQPQPRTATTTAAAVTDGDAAALDEPPPVRPRPALRLVTPQPRLTPVPQREAHLPALERPPLRTVEPSLEWDLPADVDRLPVTHVRAAALGVFALALAATLIATGWYKELPAATAFVRDNFSALSRRPAPLHQPRAAQDPPPPHAAPAAARSEPAERATEASEPPPSAAAEDRRDEPRRSSRKPGARAGRRTSEPMAAPQPTAPRPQPTTPLEGAPDEVAPAQPTPPPPTQPAPTQPPGGGFNIAPPASFDRGRDLAPPAEGSSGDNTLLPPSPTP